MVYLGFYFFPLPKKVTKKSSPHKTRESVNSFFVLLAVWASVFQAFEICAQPTAPISSNSALPLLEQLFRTG